MAARQWCGGRGWDWYGGRDSAAVIRRLRVGVRKWCGGRGWSKKHAIYENSSPSLSFNCCLNLITYDYVICHFISRNQPQALQHSVNRAQWLLFLGKLYNKLFHWLVFHSTSTHRTGQFVPFTIVDISRIEWRLLSHLLIQLFLFCSKRYVTRCFISVMYTK